MSAGFVYILENEAMPGFVKIGFTQQDDLKARLRQLDNTSTPYPFECYYAAKVPDCRALERTLHFVFGERRTRPNREFFETNPDLVKAVIELVAIQEEQAAVLDAATELPEEAQSALEQAKTLRAARVGLAELGLPPGTVLTFTKDPAVTCTVVGARSVLFREAEMSLSAAALMAIREMGYTWPSARGAEYWAYKGRKLAAMAPRD